MQIPAPPPGFQLQQPAASAPINSGMPTSQLPPVRAPEQVQGDYLRNTVLQGQVEDRAKTKEKEAAVADQNAINVRQQLVKVVRELQNIALDADDNSGWFETGTSGQFARGALPGANAGKDLAGNIKTLDATFAFDAINALRDSSATGSTGLGPISNYELDLLKAATANISPDLGHDTFLKNVERARQVYLNRLALVDPQLAGRLGFSSEAAEAAMLDLDREFQQRFGDPTRAAPAVNRAANPNAIQSTPEDIDAIMRKYGIEQ